MHNNLNKKQEEGKIFKGNTKVTISDMHLCWLVELQYDFWLIFRYGDTI